jgi:hypothetical protein
MTLFSERQQEIEGRVKTALGITLLVACVIFATWGAIRIFDSKQAHQLEARQNVRFEYVETIYAKDAYDKLQRINVYRDVKTDRQYLKTHYGMTLLEE